MSTAASILTGLVAGLQNFSPDMTDAQGEHPASRHQQVLGGPRQPQQGAGVLIQQLADGHFESGPEAVTRAGHLAIGGANHHMTGKRILL